MHAVRRPPTVSSRGEGSVHWQGSWLEPIQCYEGPSVRVSAECSD